MMLKQRSFTVILVNCCTRKCLRENKPNYKRLIEVLKRLGDTEVHVFSKQLNVIGTAKDIIEENVDKLQIREQNADLL